MSIVFLLPTIKTNSVETLRKLCGLFSLRFFLILFFTFLPAQKSNKKGPRNRIQPDFGKQLYATFVLW